MKNRVRIAVAVGGCVLSLALMACAGSVTITGLEASHLVEPGSVGQKPSFAWQMETSRTGGESLSIA